MKEAAGEANVTVITIVLIGVLAAAGAILIPRLIKTVNGRSCCTELGGKIQSGKCLYVDGKEYSFSTVAGWKNCKID